MDLVDAFVEAQRHFDETPGLLEYVAPYAGFLGGAAAFGAGTIPRLKNYMLPKPREDRLTDLLPFKEVLRDGVTLAQKDGTLVATFYVSGKSTMGLTGSQRLALTDRRQSWLDELSEDGVEIRQISQREPMSGLAAPPPTHPVRGRIMERWHTTQFERSFATAHHIVLSVRGKEEDAKERLKRAVEKTTSILKPYGVRQLHLGGVGKPSPLLSFWARQVHPGNHAKDGSIVVSGVTRKISEALYGGPIEIDRKTGLFIFSGQPGQEKYGYVVVTPKLGTEAAENLIVELLALPHELKLVQTMKPLTVERGQEVVTRKKQTVGGGQSVGGRARQEQLEGVERELGSHIDNDTKVLVEREAWVLVTGSSPEEAQDAWHAVEQVYRENKMRPAVETRSAAAIWWTQFPGIDLFQVYQTPLQSDRVARWMPFDTAPTGLDRCSWHAPDKSGGGFIVRTAQQTPYKLALHASSSTHALAHSLVMAPPGAGKSVFLAIMIASFLERFPNLRVLALDRDYGLATATRALGGRYVTFAGEGVDSVRLQPLMLKMTAEAQKHVARWLHLLMAYSNDDNKMVLPQGPEIDEQINKMVRALVEYERQGKPELRTLENLVNNNTAHDSEARRRLQRWVTGTDRAAFAARDDRFEIGNDTRLITVDMGQVLENEYLAAPVLHDLFFRTRRVWADQGFPSLVIVDESASACSHPGFREDLDKEWTRVRKLDQAIVMCFQDPAQIEALDKGFANTLRTMSAGWYFLSSGNAKWENYEPYGLTPAEWDIIRLKSPMLKGVRRPVLSIKPEITDRERETVLFDVDLSVLGNLSYAFETGGKFRLAAEAAVQSYGEEWFDHYLEDCVNDHGAREDQLYALGGGGRSGRKAGGGGRFS